MGSFAISVRDASDRAAQLTKPDDALALLQRAQRNGDDVLARAIVQHSLDRNGTGIRQADDAWSNVARSHLDNNPSLQSVVEELADIEQLSSPQILSPFAERRMHPRLTASPRRRPTYVRGRIPAAVAREAAAVHRARGQLARLVGGLPDPAGVMEGARHHRQARPPQGR